MVEEIAAPSPVLRPGVGGAFGNGWKQLWRNFADLLLAGIVFVVMTFVVGFVIGLVFALGWRSSLSSGFDILGFTGVSTTFAWHFQVVSAILGVFYYTPLFWGMMLVFLCAASGRKADLPDLFAGFKRHYRNVLYASILWWLIFSLATLLIGLLPDSVSALATVLTVVWFFVTIVLYSRLIFVPFLLLDKQLSPAEAFRTSWRWTNGHALENFVIFLMGILVMIGGLIVFLVGVIPAAMWVATAVASQYEAVRQEKETPVAFPSPLLP
jgi:hypothetical protein